MTIMIGATFEGDIRLHGVSDMLGLKQPCVVVPVDAIEQMSDTELGEAVREMVDVAWLASACVAAEWFLHIDQSRKGWQRDMLYLADKHPDSVSLLERFADEDEGVKKALDVINECRLYAEDRSRQAVAKRVVRKDAQGKYDTLFVKLGRRDGFACAQCGHTGNDLQIDHIHPVSKGGTNALSNLQLLCPPCNFAKSDKVDGEE